VLASACLPPYFQAVEVDGEHYWDGGYLGNPAIFPLIYRQGAKDVVIVQVTAITREELPQSAAGRLASDQRNQLQLVADGKCARSPLPRD
jgi:predicted acylesterase/phospholipase RssA